MAPVAGIRSWGSCVSPRTKFMGWHTLLQAHPQTEFATRSNTPFHDLQTKVSEYESDSMKTMHFTRSLTALWAAAQQVGDWSIFESVSQHIIDLIKESLIPKNIAATKTTAFQRAPSFVAEEYLS